MEKWTVDEVIKYLKDDYCRHYRNREKFLVNDNEVDADYESAQCDYIINLLKTLTEKSLNDIAEDLDELLEGVFIFDPQERVELLRQYEGKSFYAAQDILYCFSNDLSGLFDEDDIDYLLKEVLSINEYTGEVYIPKGTKMTLISVGGDTPSGWPTFEIHGEEFDFAGDAFKLKPAE